MPSTGPLSGASLIFYVLFEGPSADLRGHQTLGEEGPEAVSMVTCFQLKSSFGVFCELI